MSTQDSLHRNPDESYNDYRTRRKITQRIEKDIYTNKPPVWPSGIAGTYRKEYGLIKHSRIKGNNHGSR